MYTISISMDSSCWAIIVHIYTLYKCVYNEYFCMIIQIQNHDAEMNRGCCWGLCEEIARAYELITHNHFKAPLREQFSLF